MIAKQTVYLSSDRTKAVPAGYADAKFLLVREGHEIEEAAADPYEGAIDLIGSKATAKAARAAELATPLIPGATPEAKPARKRAVKKAK